MKSRWTSFRTTWPIFFFPGRKNKRTEWKLTSFYYLLYWKVHLYSKELKPCHFLFKACGPHCCHTARLWKDNSVLQNCIFPQDLSKQNILVMVVGRKKKHPMELIMKREISPNFIFVGSRRNNSSKIWQQMLLQNGGLAFVAQQNGRPIKLPWAVILVFNGYDSCQGAEGLSAMPWTF